MKLKIYVLSLIEATERRNKINKILTKMNIDFVFYDGVKGKEISPHDIDDIYDEKSCRKLINRGLSSGEIGATYSHYKIYKDAWESNVDFALILEDDVFLVPAFKELINSLGTEKPPMKEDDSIYFIQQHCLNNRVIGSIWDGVEIGSFKFTKMLGSSQYFVGAYGYLVPRNSLKKLVHNYLPINCVCDHWYHIKKRSGIKNFYYLKTPLVYTNDESVRLVDSFVQKERALIHISKELTVLQEFKYSLKKYALLLTNLDIE